MVWQAAIPAAINVVGSLIGANEADDAADDAERAQARAAAQQLALQREIWQDQRQLHMPYYTAGLHGMYGGTGLMNLLGHGGGSAPASSGQPENAFSQYTDGTYGQQTPAQQETDKWSRYLAANPDVMNAFNTQNLANSPHLLGGGGKGTDLDGNGSISPEEYARYHYQAHGQAENRGFGQPVQAAPAPTQPTAPAPNIIPDGNGGYRQGGDQEPLAVAGPTEGPMTQTLRQTPGYMWLQDETRRMREGSAAARGELLSGGAIAEADRQVLGLADQTYQSAVANQYNLAVLGQGGATSIQNAGNTFAAGAGNAYYNQGQAAANGAYGRANAFNQGLAGVTDAVGGYFSNNKKPQTPSITDGWS